MWAYDSNSADHRQQVTFCHTKHIFPSSEAKWDGMELSHMCTCMHVEGDLTKQGKNLKSYHTT
jgi:hypothetical protein